jgi:hypothetical protein
MTTAAVPVASKGTTLQALVSAAYVSVAGVISLDLPEQETETYEADTLSNLTPGIPYAPTFRVEGGKCAGELWLDPALSVAGQSQMAVILATTSTSTFGGLYSWQVLFKGNPFASPWPAWQFSGAGLSIGGTAALKEGIKGKFSIKLNGVPTITTSASTG